MPAEFEEDLDGKALAKGLRKRDPATIDAFMSQYRPLLQHCIGQFQTASTDREDLYQEILSYLLERIDKDRFDARKGSFGTWVYRVAWCRCVDLKRRESAGRRPRAVPNSEESAEPMDTSPGPAQAADSVEIGSLVRSCLEEIEPEEAELLRLRHMREMTLVDIAASRSQSLETVKYRLKRATAALRQRLMAHRVSQELAS